MPQDKVVLSLYLPKILRIRQIALSVVKNFGKAGDTSTQIYNRMMKSKKITDGLKKG